jgi:Asp-tRNA(Asn)/Glu-tRNA(Gln) amidotransferase A subunit family amidase
VGFQVVGDAWDEPSVLQVLAELERQGAAAVPRSKLAVDVLA